MENNNEGRIFQVTNISCAKLQQDSSVHDTESIYSEDKRRRDKTKRVFEGALCSLFLLTMIGVGVNISKEYVASYFVGASLGVLSVGTFSLYAITDFKIKILDELKTELEGLENYQETQKTPEGVLEEEGKGAK